MDAEIYGFIQTHFVEVPGIQPTILSDRLMPHGKLGISALAPRLLSTALLVDSHTGQDAKFAAPADAKWHSPTRKESLPFHDDHLSKRRAQLAVVIGEKWNCERSRVP